jgi:hypothetical protein
MNQFYSFVFVWFLCFVVWVLRIQNPDGYPITSSVLSKRLVLLCYCASLSLTTVCLHSFAIGSATRLNPIGVFLFHRCCLWLFAVKASCRHVLFTEKANISLFVLLRSKTVFGVGVWRCLWNGEQIILSAKERQILF